MEYVTGISLALAVAALPVLTGIGRGRDFYPIVLMIVASYYVLFAAVGASATTLWIELAAAAVFCAAALAGFRTSLSLVAAALIAHGLLDSVHHLLIDNPGIPAAWPGFCMAFDIVAGVGLAWQLRNSRRLRDTAGTCAQPG